MPELSVVIPCYNEAKNIPLLLQRFAAFKNVDFELVLVNNGSSDNTTSVLDRDLKKYKFARSVVVKKNIGYGYGIMTGLWSCKSPVLAYTHADLQCDPKDVFRAFDMYKKSGGKVFVKGVRVHRKLTPAMLARCLDMVASIVMKMRFYDINAQPKLFPNGFLKYFQHAPNGYYLDLFVVAKIKRTGIKIKEIPVTFEKRLYGVSSWKTSFMSRVRNIIRFFFACFEVRRLIKRNL